MYRNSTYALKWLCCMISRFRVCLYWTDCAFKDIWLIFKSSSPNIMFSWLKVTSFLWFQIINKRSDRQSVSTHETWAASYNYFMLYWWQQFVVLRLYLIVNDKLLEANLKSISNQGLFRNPYYFPKHDL